MKNILSENLLRFGVKNLSESQKRALTLKSIMETIDAHGLRQEVRKALTEADQPKDPNAVIIFSVPGGTVDAMYKAGRNAKDEYGPLVIQSPTSLKEASTILSTLMKLVGQGNAESPEMIKQIQQITANNYPAILWKVRYGSSFKAGNSRKSNYNTVSDWLSRSVDIPSPTVTGGSSGAGGGSGHGGKGIGGVRDFFIGTKTAEAIEAHLTKFSTDEGFVK
jgi:hypothetical protein